MLDIYADSLHILSTDTSFFNSSSMISKPFVSGAPFSILVSWDSKHGSWLIFLFHLRLPPVDFEPVFNSIRENRVELDLSPVLQAIQDTCPIFFGQKSPKVKRWREVTKMPNSWIVFKPRKWTWKRICRASLVTFWQTSIIGRATWTFPLYWRRSKQRNLALYQQFIA